MTKSFLWILDSTLHGPVQFISSTVRNDRPLDKKILNMYRDASHCLQFCFLSSCEEKSFVFLTSFVMRVSVPPFTTPLLPPPPPPLTPLLPSLLPSSCQKRIYFKVGRTSWACICVVMKGRWCSQTSVASLIIISLSFLHCTTSSSRNNDASR